MNRTDGELSLAPLGAGDLIDRAVRLYRRHFLTLIRIAAPPVLISATGSTFTTIAFREIAATGSTARMLLYILMILGGGLVIVCGSLFSLIVMGGATRNLVAHLLSGEPVSFRATYRAVKSRFWGLLGASLLVATWLIFAGWLAFTPSGGWGGLAAVRRTSPTRNHRVRSQESIVRNPTSRIRKRWTNTLNAR